MLKQLQQDFYQDTLNLSVANNYLNSVDFNSEDLIKIYHHQYFIVLTQALSRSYSCVKRLVGDDFFAMIARQFIKSHPSKSPNIIDYGDEFADFIANNPHCKTLPYLPDVAKFENLYEKCYYLSPKQVFFLYSKYPIIKIWQLNKNSDTLDFSNGGDYLKIYKQNHQMKVEKITQQQYEDKL